MGTQKTCRGVELGLCRGIVFVDEAADTFALCGYSLGSAVAVRVAARHPDRVTALVLTAPFAHLDTRTALASAIWQQLYDSGQHLLLAQYLTLLTLSPALTNSLSLEQILAGHQQGGFNVPEGTGAQVDLVRRSDIRDDLAGITAPTLVVVTTADPLIPARLQHQVAAGIPGAKTADLGTGHLPFLEQPARWLEIITDFLDGVGA